MKKKQIKKLSLNKIAISRLDNQHLIRGGSAITVCECTTTIKEDSENQNCPFDGGGD